MERLSQSLCTLHPEARQSMWHALEKGWRGPGQGCCLSGACDCS
jgi:hypothetical protein